ncbi:MAG: type II toxin-antitoxin system HicB family antitoxin [Rhodospirillaceae bacterium]|nr:type II toxin-antitoxin system HicB family antitoxin [Rhodospirillaceae bacterium]
MEYAVVIEKVQANHAAYVPDLPGCVATGATRDEAIREIETAIVMHIESLREHGEPVPALQSTAAVVKVAA